LKCCTEYRVLDKLISALLVPCSLILTRHWGLTGRAVHANSEKFSELKGNNVYYVFTDPKPKKQVQSSPYCTCSFKAMLFPVFPQLAALSAMFGLICCTACLALITVECRLFRMKQKGMVSILRRAKEGQCSTVCPD
jgi:hypothetical protein